MALKDITLGQYFPGHSFIHRLDPRAKIIFTVVYIVAIFLCKALVSYGLALVVLLLLIAISRVQPKVFLKGMKPVIFIVICTALLNLFYTSGTVLWSFGILKITEEGIWKAGFMVLRILMLIACTLLLTYTTSPILLTDGLERLLRPLKKVRFPVHELSMMMSIALRFIPTLIQETDKIISAQKARGADFDSGNLMQKAKALIPILIPLLLSPGRGTGHRHGMPLLPRGRRPHQPAPADHARAGLGLCGLQCAAVRGHSGAALLWAVREGFGCATLL